MESPEILRNGIRQNKSIKNCFGKDGDIEFEPVEDTNTFKEFCSELGRKLVRKLADGPNKFHNNLMKQYYMNTEKNCHNFELSNVSLETIKKILSYFDKPKASSLDRISSKSLKDDAEVLALPLCNLVSLTIKQSLFPDQYNITKVPI